MQCNCVRQSSCSSTWVSPSMLSADYCNMFYFQDTVRKRQVSKSVHCKTSCLLYSTIHWHQLSWMPGAHQSHSITAPPQLDRGEKIQQKAHGLRQGQGAITQQLPSWAKQTPLGEISFIYYQSNQSRIMRNKTKS